MSSIVEENGVVYFVNEMMVVGYTSAIKENVTIKHGYSIKDGAFKNCEKIKKVTFDTGPYSKLKISIGKEAFSGCINLKEVDASTVNIIEKCAFEDCVNLQKAHFGRTTYFFDSFAFKNCFNLKDINFENCINLYLDKYTIEDTKFFKEKQEKDKLVIIKNILIDGTKATGVVEIPNGVREIAIAAFEDANVDRIICPNSVKEILHNAFNGCQATNIYINEGVKNIAYGAIRCPKLKQLTLPSTLRCNNIYESFFCPKLKYLNWNMNMKPEETLFKCFPNLERLFYKNNLVYDQNSIGVIDNEVLNKQIKKIQNTLLNHDR